MVGFQVNPDSLAFDAAGNLYVATNLVNARLTCSPRAPPPPSAVYSGLDQPDAMVFDGSGNFDLDNYGNNTISKLSLAATGLQGNDTVAGTDVYSNDNAGSGKTLSISAYTVSDGNGGNNYTVTTATNTTGLINKASLLITATANTKNFDGTAAAAALPTVSGLQGNDKVTGLAEVYGDPNIGSSKTLSVSAYTVSDGNGGGNYAVTTAVSSSGVIDVGPFSQYVITILGSNTIVAGNSFIVTVQAADSFGNSVSSYSGPGSVTITTNPADPLTNLQLPCNLNGSGFGFVLVSLKTAGSYTLVATAGTFAGTSGSFTVVPSFALDFIVTAPAAAITGSPFNITVTAMDQYHNLVTGYNGTVQITSSIPAGSPLLGNYQFTTGPNQDNGSHTFSVMLSAAGSQTITATDAVSSSPISIIGSSGPITTRGLVVTSFAPTPTGFTATFRQGFFLPADLTLFTFGQNQKDGKECCFTTGAHVGPIHGFRCSWTRRIGALPSRQPPVIYWKRTAWLIPPPYRLSCPMTPIPSP